MIFTLPRIRQLIQSIVHICSCICSCVCCPSGGGLCCGDNSGVTVIQVPWFESLRHGDVKFTLGRIQVCVAVWSVVLLCWLCCCVCWVSMCVVLLCVLCCCVSCVAMCVVLICVLCCCMLWYCVLCWCVLCYWVLCCCVFCCYVGCVAVCSVAVCVVLLCVLCCCVECCCVCVLLCGLRFVIFRSAVKPLPQLPTSVYWLLRCKVQF